MAVLPFAALADWLLAAPPQLGPVRLVGVDGPTGSGKSTFAWRLVAALGDTVAPSGPAVVLLHTDQLLDGWTDTVTFWPRLRQWVLDPLRDGRPAAYRTYDWHAGRFCDTWTPVPGGCVLVLDGVTSARTDVRPALSLAVWMDVPFDRSLARAVRRDGPAYAEELAAWHERERAHFAADATVDHADLVVDTDPTVPHDPTTELITVHDRRHRSRPGTAPVGGATPC